MQVQKQILPLLQIIDDGKIQMSDYNFLGINTY